MGTLLQAIALQRLCSRLEEALAGFALDRQAFTCLSGFGETCHLRCEVARGHILDIRAQRRKHSLAAFCTTRYPRTVGSYKLPMG